MYQQLANAKSRVWVGSDTVWLCLIFSVGAFLRLYRLDFQSLWLDEGLQYDVATRNSLRELFFQVRSFHPPLSFLINHVFLWIEPSDFFLRLPSALFGIGSLPLLYILARDLTSRQNAICAVLVLAISPFHLWYSQDARMYSQLMFFSLLSSVVLIQALKRGELRWWFYYTVAAGAGVYTHVFMALTLGAHFFWVMLCHRQYALHLAMGGLVVVLLFLPWIIFLPWVSGFAHSVSTVGLTGGSTSGGRAGFTWAAVPYTFFVYAAGFSLGPTVAELHGNKNIEFVLHFLPSILVVSAVFAILLLTGVWVIYKRFGLRPWTFSVLGFCLPLAGTLLYAMTARGTFNVRYTISAFPFFCLFAGTALGSFTRVNKVAGTIAVLAVLGIFSTSMHNYFADPRYAKEDVRSAVSFWRRVAPSEPLIAVGSGSTQPARRYLGAAEEKRFVYVGGRDIVAPIQRLFSADTISSAYVLLARDWNQTNESAIRKVFATSHEQTYPGVKIFRIERPDSRASTHGSASR